MNFFKSSAKEPKQNTWKELGKRFQKSGFEKQGDWMDSCLKRNGFDPNAWMKTGEMPSELIYRYAKESKEDIDSFLLKTMK